MPSNLVGSVRSGRVAAYTDCPVPNEPAGAVGDWQVLAWVSHISIATPTLAAPWVKIHDRNTLHSHLVIWKRQLTSATAAANGLTFGFVGAHQGGESRIYRGNATDVTILGAADGYVAPARASLTGRLVRVWADAESNSASLPPDKVLTIPAALTGQTDYVYRNFQWYNGLATGDDPTAYGANAPSRTAVVNDLNGGAQLTRYPQYADVLLTEPAPAPVGVFNVKQGASAVSAFKVGSSSVSRIYLGSNEVFRAP